MKTYDLICIGAGSGGLNIASFMNRIGLKVLLIDKSDENIGGDCLNSGCVPSKALIHIGDIFYHHNQASKYTTLENKKANMKLVKEYIESKIETIRKHENAQYFKDKGMDVQLGFAKFASKNSVIVNNQEFYGKKIILATGSSPKKLNIPGIEKVDYLTNENVFNLDQLPDKLLVIGGGPIGIELSQAFARLGSEVTILIKNNNLLPKEDRQISQILAKQLEKEQIKIIYNTKTIEFKSRNKILVEINGKKDIISFDKVLISIGRELNISGLDLEKAGIKTNEDHTKLIVNEYLQTTNPNVLVCGDVAGAYQFTHCAELHATVIINNFFNKFFRKKVDYSKLSWVTYTYPQIGTFGLSENYLKQNNIKYDLVELDLEDDDRAIVEEYTEGLLKLFISKNKILGGTLISKNAGEIIQELILVQSGGIKISKIFDKIYPYPTGSRINKKAIGQYYSKKITTNTSKILRILYSIG